MTEARGAREGHTEQYLDLSHVGKTSSAPSGKALLPAEQAKQARFGRAGRSDGLQPYP